MTAWPAFRNMMRAAARDPIWAFVAVLLSPFRAGKYLLQMLFITTLILFAMTAVALLISHFLGLSKSNPVYFLLFAVAVLVTIVSVFRMLTNPMIQHFGDRSDTTHGSARFATNAEASRLTQNGNGLLIGRDLKTGRPLRYNGPAHLLTMAPTRSGKGVSGIIPIYSRPTAQSFASIRKAETHALLAARAAPLDPFTCWIPLQ